MARMIFVNLPVSDIRRATAFYEAVGGVKNEQFCDGSTSCMMFSDTIFVMLLDHRKFGSFTPKQIADSRVATEVLLCLSADSRNDVDAMVAHAEAAGGKPDPSPKQDLGFMYGRSYEDPDGHIWEVVWMDMTAMGEAPAPAEAVA